MAVEVCSYRLSLRGTAVGTHVLRTEHRGQITHLEGRLMLQGSLGQLTTTQVSRVQRRRNISLAFREDTERRGENRVYDVVFDASRGQVRASRGPGDEAAMPYILPYRDPLGLLNEIRGLEPSDEPVRVPMLGKEVSVLYLGTTELDTALGKRAAYAYRLHPGNSYVYVEAAEPHAILQMGQRIDGQLLDVMLMKIAQEDAMPVRESERPRQGKKRRRRRRRR
jgi:hypothetical protein